MTMKVWTSNSCSYGLANDLSDVELVEEVLAGPRIWTTKELAMEACDYDINAILEEHEEDGLERPEVSPWEGNDQDGSWRRVIDDQVYEVKWMEVREVVD